MPKPAPSSAGDMEITEEYVATSVLLRLRGPQRRHYVKIQRFFEASNLSAVSFNVNQAKDIVFSCKHAIRQYYCPCWYEF
jgi:hypothetical protein